MAAPPGILMRELLGDELLVKKDGFKPTAEPISLIDGKYVGLYFSAHWCPPCRAFTPKLKQAYQSLTASGKPFEIVFVSSDQSDAEFREYFAEMPWTAIPFQSQKRSALGRRYGVMGIPTLVILSPDGRVITKNARSAVISNPEGFPWEGEEESSASPIGSWLRSLAMLFAIWFIVKIIFKL
mmetsp:Transcript_7305/g.15959  ORF Transcript_7305/g.15959 Transcript_7305/m.15959 type:complete len:182 (-) Transcript_7305:90-635(-)